MRQNALAHNIFIHHYNIYVTRGRQASIMQCASFSQREAIYSEMNNIKWMACAFSDFPF
jgi:hypothetical protein